MSFQTLVEQTQIYNTFCLSDDEQTLYFIRQKQLIGLNVNTKKAFIQINFPEQIQTVADSLICTSLDEKYCCVAAKNKSNIHSGYQLCIFDLKNQKYQYSLEEYHKKSLIHFYFIQNTHYMYSFGKDNVGYFINVSDNLKKIIKIEILYNMFKFIRQPSYSLQFLQPQHFDPKSQLQIISDKQIIIMATLKETLILSIKQGRLLRKIKQFPTKNFRFNFQKIKDQQFWFLTLNNGIQTEENTSFMDNTKIVRSDKNNCLFYGTPSEIIKVPLKQQGEI